MTRSIRAGMGLGDALYLQAIVRHLVDHQALRVCTAYPDVFRPHQGRIELAPFTRQGINILAHYTTRKSVVGTDQFEDCCITAGIHEPVDLVIDWQREEGGPAAEVQRIAAGRRVVLVQLPRSPMGRKDGFGHELLPDCRVIQRLIDRVKGECLVVQVGAGAPLFKFSGIEVDLRDRTTVPQLLDVASIAAGFLGYVSFFVPLAESFKRPALLVWSKLQRRANTAFIRQITPQKILHRESSKHVVDDWTEDRIALALADFLAAVRLPK